MTVPGTPPTTDVSNSKLIRIAIWVAIGALIAAAIVCVVWVLVGTANGIIGRAFLTILLLAAFAGVAILDSHLASRREPWFALTSMVVWVVTLLVGAVMIWMPERYDFYDNGLGRFFSFLLIVLILQLGMLHLRLYTRAWRRHRTRFIDIVAIVTIALVALLAIMLVFPLMFNEWIRFHDIYWRLVVAIAILAAVGTALVPLVNALFAPKRAGGMPAGAAWPTFVDGVTPLPVLPDGNPDWNAYYTGYPTPGARILAPPPVQHQPLPQAAAPQSPIPTQSPIPAQPPLPPMPPHPVPPHPQSQPTPPQPPQFPPTPPVPSQQAQPPVPPQGPPPVPPTPPQ